MEAQTNLSNLSKKALLEQVVLLGIEKKKIEKINVTLQANIDHLKNQNDLLVEALRLAKCRHYGSKSESFSSDQYSLFDEPESPDNIDEIEAVEESIVIEAHTRKKKPGRKGLPKSWPRLEKVYDLTKEQKQCPCGCELTCIGDERTEQVEFIPASKYVIVHVQKKYACQSCESTLKQAKKPVQPIPKSIAGPKLLASVLTSKYQYHLPLYRQEQIFKQMDLTLARNTLSLWVIRCSELLSPLEKLMADSILSYDIAYSDETKVQVLKEKDRVPEKLSWMWLFGGGPPDKFSFIYRYDVSRSHEVPLQFFEDYSGYLHCDGWGAYEVLAKKNPKIILNGCLYHIRRKFFDAHKIAKKKSGIASQVLNIIQDIAKIEKNIQHLPFNEIHQHRLEHEKPLLEKLHALLIDKQPKVVPKSTLGKAITYALNQWPKLLVYLQDGRLENNNNRTERGIKPFAKGRDNWTFCNSVDGATASARIYSFVETCKYHDIEPYYWFAYVLEKLPQCQTLEELEALLPYNIDKNLLNPKNFVPQF